MTLLEDRCLSTEFRSPTTALDAIGFGRFQFQLLCYAGLAYFADACETMLLSFLGPAVRCQWGVSAGSESALTSVVFAGMMCGVYVMGALSDSHGRRRGFLASAVLLGAAGLASALAPSFVWLVVSRAVVGVALGGTPIAVTLFAEFMPTSQRGRWLLVLQGSWTLGTMFEAGLAWAVLPRLGWRWLLALSAAPLLLLLLLYPWLPESPHWLMVQGRYQEAEAVVLRVATANRYGRQMRLDFGGGHLDGGNKLAHGSPCSSPCHPLARAEAAVGGPAGEGRQPHPTEKPRGQISHHTAAWEGGSSGGSPQGPHESPREGAGAVAAAAAWQQQQQQQAAAGQQHYTRRGRRRPPGDGPAGEESASVARPLVYGVEEARRAGAAGGVRRLLRKMQAAFRQLLGPRLRRTTLLLYLIWFVNAITYYGLVLLTTALQTASKKHACTEDGRPDLSTSDFTSVIITSMAEAPGLLLAAALVDWWGRRWTLRSLLLCCACCSLLLARGPGGSAWQLLLLFMARGGIEGSFCTLYIYTPELYPTAVRGFGLALCSAFSRIGGFLAPYATVYLVAEQDPQASELLLGTLCLAAMLAAFFLPIETLGMDLAFHEHDLDESALPPNPAHHDPGEAPSLGPNLHPPSPPAVRWQGSLDPSQSQDREMDLLGRTAYGGSPGGEFGDGQGAGAGPAGEAAAQKAERDPLLAGHH